MGPVKSLAAAVVPRTIPTALFVTDQYYAVGTDFKVYRHYFKPKLGKWEFYSKGSVKQVEHSEFWNGKRYLVGLGTDNKNMYMGMVSGSYDGSNDRSWRRITDEFKVTMFILDGPNIYGLGEEDGAIYACTIQNPTEKDCFASAWNPVTKGGMSSFTLEGRFLYAVGADNQVYTCTDNSGGEWSRMTQGQPGITQVEVINSTIYGLGLDTKIYHWYGGKWRPLTPGGATKFVLSEDYIHALHKDQCVWRTSRLHGADKWSYVTGPAVIHIARPFGALRSKM